MKTLLSVIATLAFIALVGHALLTELRLRTLEAKTPRAWDCAAGHVLSECERTLGEPAQSYPLRSPGERVSLWREGPMASSTAYAVVARDGIIAEVLNLETGEGSDRYKRLYATYAP